MGEPNEGFDCPIFAPLFKGEPFGFPPFLCFLADGTCLALGFTGALLAATVRWAWSGITKVTFFCTEPSVVPLPVVDCGLSPVPPMVPFAGAPLGALTAYPFL